MNLELYYTLELEVSQPQGWLNGIQRSKVLQMSCVALWTKSGVLVMRVLRFVVPALFPVANKEEQSG